MRRVLFLLAISFLGLMHPAWAQERARRLALVIGNDSYSQISKLENARADATAIARALERAGFKVSLKTDTDFSAFKAALRAFKADLRSGDEAIFYFSGHGVELGGANYLLPVDVKGDSEDQVRDDSVPLQRVLEDLQERKARFALAIVDACRNNPFRTGGRSIGGRGLAPTTAATGQMVFYSAGSGQQALDQLGPKDPVRNGVFTRVLLREMQKPGVPVSDVLRNVREEVASLAKSVGKEQVPAIYDQSLGRFFFVPSGDGQSVSATPVQPLGPRPDESTVDLAFWESIKNSTLAQDYDEYLRQFPSGRFSGLAVSRRDRLQQATSSPQGMRPEVDAAITAQGSASSVVRAPSGAIQSLTRSQVRGRSYFGRINEYEIEVEAGDSSLRVEKFSVTHSGLTINYRCGVFSNSILFSADTQVVSTLCSPFSGPTGMQGVGAFPPLTVSGIFPVLIVSPSNNSGMSRPVSLSNPTIVFIDSQHRASFDAAQRRYAGLTTEQFAWMSANPR